jgi:cellulose synthase/poly-beta-1,6-N-acetylglucosamine synthase-like glycosyltransferase
MKIAQDIALWVFWISCGIILYAYILYPIILFLIYAFVQLRRDVVYLWGRRDRRAAVLPGENLPSVSLVVAAYNEGTRLAEKLVNIQALDYPRDRFEVIFVSDGSTDRTNEILQSTAAGDIRCIFLEKRGGKARALNYAVADARHDILVFSDASTLFEPDAVRKLVRHFSDARVGGVCGSVKFQSSKESQQTEGVYWKFESILRLMEARLGATLTASGAIYALRREAYQPLATGAVLDDFVVPMNSRRAGYCIQYDPEAIAIEFAPETIAGEFKRRVRLATGSFTVLADFLRIPLNGITVFAFFSHKICRWFVPFFLVALLPSNMLLFHGAYRVFLIAQVLFYLWAGLGFAFRGRIKRVPYALLGYFLLAMNLAFLVGFFRFVAGNRDVTWERVDS